MNKWLKNTHLDIDAIRIITVNYTGNGIICIVYPLGDAHAAGNTERSSTVVIVIVIILLSTPLRAFQG